MNTEGFYKVENEELLYAPNFVIHAQYSLYRPEFHKRHKNGRWTTASQAEKSMGKPPNKSPMDGGWYWFDSEEDARTFFGIEELKDNN